MRRRPTEYEVGNYAAMISEEMRNGTRALPKRPEFELLHFVEDDEIRVTTHKPMGSREEGLDELRKLIQATGPTWMILVITVEQLDTSQTDQTFHAAVVYSADAGGPLLMLGFHSVSRTRINIEREELAGASWIPRYSGWTCRRPELRDLSEGEIAGEVAKLLEAERPTGSKAVAYGIGLRQRAFEILGSAVFYGHPLPIKMSDLQGYGMQPEDAPVVIPLEVKTLKATSIELPLLLATIGCDAILVVLEGLGVSASTKAGSIGMVSALMAGADPEDLDGKPHGLALLWRRRPDDLIKLASGWAHDGDTWHEGQIDTFPISTSSGTEA